MIILYKIILLYWGEGGGQLVCMLLFRGFFLIMFRQRHADKGPHCEERTDNPRSGLRDTAEVGDPGTRWRLKPDKVMTGGCLVP